MRILVVEDDERLASILVRGLREETYAVDHAKDGQDAEWLAFENPYDVIVLDLMLPIQDGMTVLRKLRAGGINTPVIVLTAKDMPDDIVGGLDSGADDYLTKPFRFDELLARIRALLRRPKTDSQAILSVGSLRIDPSRREVMRFEERIDLTAKEYALLEYLARHAGSVVSRTQISEHVWDMNFDPMSNVVDVYVGYLRNKIDKAYGTQLIRTVRGHGYMLDAEGESEASDASIPAGAATKQATGGAVENPHVS